MPKEVIEIILALLAIIYPLGIIGLGFYFKKKFATVGEIVAKHDYKEHLEEIERSISKGKEDGEITTKHFRKELLADIKKYESDASNNSEFEYHKRKEDSERLERFNLLLFSAFDYDEKHYENCVLPFDDLHSEIHKLLKINKKEITGINIIDLITKYYPSKNRQRNFKLYEAKVIYDLYLKEYQNSKFNDFFYSWYIKSIKFNKTNQYDSELIIKEIIKTTKANTVAFKPVNLKDIENMIIEIENIIEKIRLVNEPLMYELGTSFTDLLSSMTSISEDIRKSKKVKK